MRKTPLFSLIVLFIALTACSNKNPTETLTPTPTVVTPSQVELTTVTPPIVSTVEPYEDVRKKPWDNEKRVVEKKEYSSDDILTFSFNEGTVFKGNEELQSQIMEDGKNPGLGIRSLHEQGITGKGINVAIIDQNLLLDHPEFAGKIVEYYDTGCEVEENSGSMHAPAVTSLLCGDTIGVAPGVNVYFAAAPSWTGDATFYADALDWIIGINDSLPENEKIRVVSVSADPTESNYEPFTNGHLWNEAVERAQAAGILVLDCRNNDITGIIGPAYYDYNDRENPYKCKAGYPVLGIKHTLNDSDYKNSRYIFAPSSMRTTAEEYWFEDCSYAYWGRGGLSWAIPYAAGVLALGWQVNPELGNEEIINFLYESACINEEGFKIIDPVAFIEKIKSDMNT